MTKDSFTIDTRVVGDGEEIRLSRSVPWNFVIAAEVNKRLRPLGTSLVLDTSAGWYLRNGEHRSPGVDTNTDPTNTIVLTRPRSTSE